MDRAATSATDLRARSRRRRRLLCPSRRLRCDCGPPGDAGFEHPDWPLGGDGEHAFLPVVASSLVSVGPSRFLYNVLDEGYRQLAARGCRQWHRLLRPRARRGHARHERGGQLLSSGLGRGLYRATVDFDCAGEWGCSGISLTLADGSTARERLRFQVQPAGTHGIGAPAPRSDSLTATTVQEVRRISTDPNPYAAAYTQTVAEAVTSGRPSLDLLRHAGLLPDGLLRPDRRAGEGRGARVRGPGRVRERRTL